MILAHYAKFLQSYNEDLLLKKTTPLKLLPVWLETIIYKTPKNNVEKIINKEILYCKNGQGDYAIIGKSDSGRVLVNALINFAQSYDNYTHSKWLEIVEKTYHN